MNARFRAFDKKTSKIYGVGLPDYYHDVAWLDDVIEDECVTVATRKLTEIELMQSTGLKDDFGKELFVDDVILWSYWDEFEDSGRAKIIFYEGMFKLVDIRTGKDVWDNLFNCLENCDVYLQGNIYENPEFWRIANDQ
mgnify:CR=1 FL=1